ncbi:MAG: TIM44-like domain-containing protein [Clostridiales bacterium]|nr:TIM44-like domain-containing protein [Clostridiales bacterium]
MNNNNRLMMAVLLLLAAAICVCMLTVGVGADFGGFSGDADFGGGGGGGGGYDGGGSSYDWGDDSDSSGSTELDDGTAIVIAVIFVIVVVVSLFRSKTKPKSPTTIQGGGAQATDISTLLPISQYLEVDPQFSEQAFIEKLANLYVQMQYCWTAKDIEQLRPYFSDSIFNQMASQLDMMKKSRRTNYVERIAVMSVNISGWRSDETDDVMVARLKTRITDYTLDDTNGNLISGSRTAEKFMDYEWILKRTRGKTTQALDGTQALHCPSCGAPLDVNHSAKCEYCGTVITTDDYDWVINSMKAISQQTVGN